MRQGYRVTGAFLLPSALLAGALGCAAAGSVDQAPAAAPAAAASEFTLTVDMPNEMVPMTIAAMVGQPSVTPGDTVAVVVGVRLLPGWHTYAVVPPTEPYVQTKWTLEPGPGLIASGEWLVPPPVPDAHNPALKLYESTADPLVFRHALRVADTASGELKVKVSVLFQVCDAFRCLPPAEQFFDLKLKVVTEKAEAAQ